MPINYSNPTLLYETTAGHIHRNSMELIKGKPQIVAEDNASRGYLDINFLPMKVGDKALIF